MSRLPFALLALLIACSPTAEDPDPTPEPTPEPRQGPDYSMGSCPELVQGWNLDFSSGDDERSFRLELPDDPQGAPLVFAWHWMGGQADQIVDWLDLDEMAREEGFVLVAPASNGSTFEWGFLLPPDDNPDLLFFEDMLSCLWQQYDIDLDRVYATGMSAGGLWTSYLTEHEAQWLTATAPMSGGVVVGSYVAPTRRIPVLLTWGGESDQLDIMDFNENNLYFSEELRADGHFVAHCVHDEGHDIPPEIVPFLWDFFDAHPQAEGDEPYASGLPDDYPDYCYVPDQVSQ